MSLRLGIYLAGFLAATAFLPCARAEARPEIQALPEPALLEIGIPVFGNGAHESGEAAALRQAESRYVAYLLRQVIEQSGQWGPVRVLPPDSPPTELLVRGDILVSSGAELTLAIEATDATGRGWLDRTYTTTARVGDYGDPPEADPFRPMYDKIAADLVEVRSSLALSDLQRIIDITRLRQAQRIAPAAFSAYIARQPDGTFHINRLPAETDPMMERIERIRAAENLFVDVVDQYFAAYFREMAPTYLAWKKAALEARLLMAEYRHNAPDRSGRDYRSMKGRYNDFREVKLFEQTLRESLESFDLAMGPTTLELQDEVVELTGTLEEQQAQWRELLEQIYADEVGLPAGD